MDIAKKVDLLFKTVKSGDREYSYREIVDRAGGAVTSTSIWKVRNGKIKNPSQRLLGALSQAFQVPVAFFFDESVTAENVLAYRKRYYSEQMVERIALRASELDDEGKQAVLDMIDLASKLSKTQAPGKPEGKQ